MDIYIECSKFIKWLKYIIFLDRNQKLIDWLNGKVDAASKEVDGEKSEEEQGPENFEHKKKEEKKPGSRDSQVIILLL